MFERLASAVVKSDAIASPWLATMTYSLRLWARISSCLFPRPLAWEQFSVASEIYLKYPSPVYTRLLINIGHDYHVLRNLDSFNAERMLRSICLQSYRVLIF